MIYRVTATCPGSLITPRHNRKNIKVILYNQEHKIEGEQSRIGYFEKKEMRINFLFLLLQSRMPLI
jgi:hypothetical protein